MDYYNEQYFKWQKEIGEFGGIINQFLFKDFIALADAVIDFGCGGGYLLSNINCTQKMGIEINDAAREIAKKKGYYDS